MSEPRTAYITEAERAEGDQAMASSTTSTPALRVARSYLEQALARGPLPAAEIIERGKAEWGLSEATIERARREIGVRSVKQKGALSGSWRWALPACELDAEEEQEQEGDHSEPRASDAPTPASPLSTVGADLAARGGAKPDPKARQREQVRQAWRALPEDEEARLAAMQESPKLYVCCRCLTAGSVLKLDPYTRDMVCAVPCQVFGGR